MERLILSKLLEWKAKTSRKPLLLRGARQVGKSWVLKDLGSHFGSSHYINFERDNSFQSIFTGSLNPVEIIRKLEIILNVNINEKKDLLIFDEIQDCPKALTSLKYFCEDLPEMAVCAAGSQLGINFSSTDSFPVGKVENLRMSPMTFEEFLIEKEPRLHKSFLSFEISDFEHELLKKAYFNYLFTGGMPEAVKNFENKLKSIKNVRQVQEDLLVTYQSE